MALGHKMADLVIHSASVAFDHNLKIWPCPQDGGNKMALGHAHKMVDLVMHNASVAFDHALKIWPYPQDGGSGHAQR